MKGVLGFLSFFCFLSRTGPGADCENEAFSCSLPAVSGSSSDLSVERDTATIKHVTRQKGVATPCVHPIVQCKVLHMTV